MVHGRSCALIQGQRERVEGILGHGQDLLDKTPLFLDAGTQEGEGCDGGSCFATLRGENRAGGVEGRGHLEEPQNEASTTDCTMMKLGESGSSVPSFESDFSVM